MPLSAEMALTALREGNRRFVAGTSIGPATDFESRRRELTAGQRPFAVILGCSDSRVPAELVFDRGLGDLFVIRVAGNIVAPSLVGSVEFAAAKFGTRLVVVLGHTQCGAIEATVDDLQKSGPAGSENVEAIVERIRPAVQPLIEASDEHDRSRLIAHAGRANVRMSANQLRHGSELLEQMIRDDGLRVVGAEYSPETGAVDFFDGADDIA